MLDRFHFAVEEGRSQLTKLVLALSYLLISVAIVIILYIKKIQLLKESGPFLAVFAGIAIYIALVASVNLNHAIEDVRYFYALLNGDA
ncbi:hypothetical protein D3H55_16880 [Bacillus salacetis]|uniref:Uncharacterized protein n=1 Tax=Bacillus salacetis TaxID=2315464 RepID=A0A3A1QT55_9BACI|nr:hypothetical protein [Bacillus salacetis]RIW30408.1 hypothetical protein D3H55_16880 [Bacillus salacetis]